MNSLERLEIIKNRLLYESNLFKEDLEIIKKDLEHYENLKKTNQELNRQLDLFYKNMNKNQLRACDIFGYENWNLEQENDKLKKQIETLKRDLEVLEILKKYLVIQKLKTKGSMYISLEDENQYKDINEYIDEQNEDFNKVKEWLENE